MIAVGVVGSWLVLQRRLAEPPTNMSALHTDGPFRSILGADGTSQLGAAVKAVYRGEAFGWASSFCVAPETRLLMQVRLVHVADNRVLLYRERDLPADGRGCSSAAWSLVLPADAPPGHYQLQRFLMLTPMNDMPRVQTLPAIEMDVQAAQEGGQ